MNVLNVTATEYTEAQIRLMARMSSMHDVMVGVHNACAHGDIFDETCEDVSDSDLDTLFDHFDAIIDLLEK